MDFIKYLFDTKKNIVISAILSVFFAIFYVLIHLPFTSLLKNWEEIDKGPFQHVPFRFNLFNFDPSMYYGNMGNSLIHPFLNFLSKPLGWLTTLGEENLIFLILQSLIMGASVSLIFIYGIKNKMTTLSSLLISLIFGFSTYSLMLAVIPDSYIYAQLFIIVSILYLQYVDENNITKIGGTSTLAAINFGITITNAIPYALSVAIMESKQHIKIFLQKMFKIAGFSLGIIVVLTLFDYLYFSGNSWVSNWATSLEKGGTSYATSFIWETHKHVLNSLLIAPFFFPILETMDLAIVTHNINPFSEFVKWSGISFLILSFIGLILNLKNKKVLILVTYIVFSLTLHLLVGFGLVAHNYDMFLYAGHFFFAIVLGLGWLLKKVQRIQPLYYLIVSVLTILLVIQVIHNIGMLKDLRDALQIYFN